MKYAIIIIISAGINLLGFSQQRILFANATVHVGNGDMINQGLVGVVGEEIVLVENALTYTLDRTQWDTIIELRGKHLYPGFIAPNSTLGLTEIDAVRATIDFDEVGTYNPHIRSLIAFNAESQIIATVKTNGVLYAQATPQGGVISGTSSVLHMDGWNWEDAAVKIDDGIHLNWPQTLQGGGWWAEPAPKKANEKYGEETQKIKDFFTAAKAYGDGAKSFDQRYDAMQNIFKGTQRLYIHANELKALLDIIEFCYDFNIKYPVIVGGYDSYLITRQLKDAGIPIILKGGHTLPENEDDPIDLPNRLPKLLKEGGVNFCLQNSGGMETMNTRNLPFLAGNAMAYGLSEEEAVRAVTLSAAEILGIDNWIGSIEKGKKASLFVSDGNALEMKTHHVSLAMINGKFVSLTNRQLELYKTYKKKYEKG
ncbi:MAG: amidohydrolase family protein [Brumimicrobium sp.]|nr:amidohydrolase family protein [Brumimicrobium sp.]